jgi:predicted transcriptional regulator
MYPPLIAGEDIKEGQAVYVADDGKLYVVKPFELTEFIDSTAWTLPEGVDVPIVKLEINPDDWKFVTGNK